MRELQGDEDEDEYEDLDEKPTVKTESPAQVEQVAEVKAEPGVKEEPKPQPADNGNCCVPNLPANPLEAIAVDL
ncbi:hypothetical protein PF005_g2507 [Phytophthora fragariae]|uniref:Uncharacterized protein n=1 Tax=Phytophthora fragariae TaxID=53985 RepID=A0A6A3TGH5_9STRA|nr:hypothetical protein PF003_g29792 [Phytophthora fragariae]KAE8947694.1 hypothetical protein PF009_g2696 [Phytophthora fragariae]KAE9027618.1 hypothetical protein PF011_g1970 [Phytophthora fragariae]KAE9135535.1 hypothetical protein PF010_g2063 [Phytophthora fragariae]KAE9135649.1 hypothetical protein PF007_g2494 [Phytophthora fragariae]